MATDAERAGMLTYSTATQEQIAEARTAARRKLAEADAYWTPEKRAAANAEYDRRIASVR